MSADVNYVASRLSLRKPQREALEILHRVCELMPLNKGLRKDEALAKLHADAQFKCVQDFERDFPSLCYALATGVGKTRLMGAFIGYLHRAHGIRHFFVLAPNLTIYDKLITDFTAGSAKYVLQGLSEFATNPPEIITGDNYESGRGVRRYRGQQAVFDDAIHINIFNISKINSEVRGDKEPRIKRLSEYIGESYFDYLSKLDDLVMLMDESHRYRASAGIKAINELKPIIGLEMTATPQVERGAQDPIPFKNVIYSYPLSDALKDGYVKEPAVATRQNFNKDNFDEASLEKLKLEDGVRVHEATKVKLEAYASENGVKKVKPFMLVIAKDTEHAELLKQRIEADDFFDGQYKGKVITVHSAQRGEEKDETVQQLLTVEDPANETEIVIHVNMLKEGWDVTNLYTIVPLRTANSKTLVEQSIGRGLRLPYGKRVADPANPEVDMLTIVAHDKFQEIVDEAKNPASILKAGIKVVYIPEEKLEVKQLTPKVDVLLGIAKPEAGAAVTKPLFEKPEEIEVAKAAVEIIKTLEKMPSIGGLTKPEVQKQIVAKIEEQMTPAQKELISTKAKVDVAKVVMATTQQIIDLTITIPRIVVVPTGPVKVTYKPFELDAGGLRLQPVEADILRQSLQTGDQYKLVSGDGVIKEAKLEDFIVRNLIDFDDVDYEQVSDVIYKLAGQMVAHLKTYLKTEADLLKVLQHHQKALAQHIHAQMLKHRDEAASDYVAQATKGFTKLSPGTATIKAGEGVRDFREPVDDKKDIRRMVFGGFSRCVYELQKFDSDSERKFAMLLEKKNNGVLKWCRPSRQDLKIYPTHGEGEPYEPDFVVEREADKLLCEVKAENEINTPEVQAKVKAAKTWCENATKHELENGGKPWKYMLVAHNKINESATLDGLLAG
ncbi:MAG: DEAD/DEAH box helicase family protein [Planctomycetes bacterium]|nr:DEAD/DEAH box helicase family protein [Planctomycetota bacterium]MCW8134467.1 DEAD/DEAH box helicase family protein [Planctomycetota bacterium]